MTTATGLWPTGSFIWNMARSQMTGNGVTCDRKRKSHTRSVSHDDLYRSCRMDSFQLIYRDSGTALSFWFLGLLLWLDTFVAGHRPVVAAGRHALSRLSTTRYWKNLVAMPCLLV